jgi:DNA-directed RNA polymerase specialized sigma24 family protein
VLRRPVASSLLLRASWKRLPARERMMFTLLLYEKLTPTETARALGCSVRDVVRTVESRLEKLSHSARLALVVRNPRVRASRAAEARRRAA